MIDKGQVTAYIAEFSSGEDQAILTYRSLMLVILTEDNTFLSGTKGKQSSGGSNWITSSEVDALICKIIPHPWINGPIRNTQLYNTNLQLN